MPDMGNLFKPDLTSLNNNNITNFEPPSQYQNHNELNLYSVEIKTLDLSPYSNLDQFFPLQVSNFNTNTQPNTLDINNNNNLETQTPNQLNLYPLEIKSPGLDNYTTNLPVSNSKPNAKSSDNTITTTNTKTQTQAQNQNEINLNPVSHYSDLNQTFSVPVSNFNTDITNSNNTNLQTQPNNKNQNQNQYIIPYSNPNVLLPFQLSPPKMSIFPCGQEFGVCPLFSGQCHGSCNILMVECYSCQKMICRGEEVFCSVRDCLCVFHLSCIEGKHSFSTKKLKCPQHACFLCKQMSYWRCIKCSLASHDRCAAFPEGVIHINDQPGRVVCWRHPSDWRVEKKLEIPGSDIKEILCHLPLPSIEEEFKIDFTWIELEDNKWEPPSYVHIRRNSYLIKKKRSDVDDDTGCTNCSSEQCCVDCVCRVQCISCSKACQCSDMCTNRPFRKEKKISLVKTELCGWGVEAAVSINEGEFVIEYVGEVIDDAICTQRLWDMKYKGVKNFYLCEIEKNFIIDATYKGNISRFLNHSCQPNCKLERWQVDGETRVAVFAARSIRVGEPLTYDYRFVQFGQEVKCHCGAPNCQGYLGTKKKVDKIEVGWGLKRKRTQTLSCLPKTGTSYFLNI